MTQEQHNQKAYQIEKDALNERRNGNLELARRLLKVAHNHRMAARGLKNPE